MREKSPRAVNVKELRSQLHLSQPQFAARFGFCLGTVRQWEQGRREPDGAARILLTVIAYAPNAVDQALKSAGIAA